MSGPESEVTEAHLAEIVRSARVVAVVGMKDGRDPLAPAFTVPRRMNALGIRTIPVNPMIDASLGEHALDRVGELTEKVDVIQIFRRADAVGPIADEIIAMPPALRPSVVWLQSGIVNEEAAEKMRRSGIYVVMDRCFGVEAAMHRRG